MKYDFTSIIDRHGILDYQLHPNTSHIHPHMYG